MNDRSDIPEINAVKEQIERAKYFFGQSLKSTSDLDSWRNLIAATYFGRAALEIMREVAKQERLSVSPKEFDAHLTKLLPRYKIIKEIRIRDFHRYAVPNNKTMEVEGRVSIPANTTYQFVMNVDLNNPQPKYLDEEGQEVKSEIFVRSSSKFQDASMTLPVELESIMAGYLKELPVALDLFYEFLRSS